MLPSTALSYLITGGTGSLGQALTRRLLADPATRRIIVYSRNYLAQQAMHAAFGRDPRLEFHREADVRSLDRLMQSMRACPDVVIHAAALKHIEACEVQPDAAKAINVDGTENVLRAAIEFNVPRVLVISSDKAAESVTTYGTNKAAAESLALRWEGLRGASPTRVSVLRYGNCFDSHGAVLHKLRAWRNSRQPIELTDLRMTRFWWSVADAAAFVESVRDRMGRAQIWVPKIGAASLVDFAEIVYPHAPVEVTGLRGIEKLHEVMVSADESRVTWELPDAYVIAPVEHVSTVPTGAVKVPDGFRYASDTAPRADLSGVAA